MQDTRVIEGYDSFERIAMGGMATVYRARKISLDIPVAVKVLFPHLAEDEVYLERFKREARAAARLQHDSIVNVLDYGESDGSHYIVMEYYDGETLEELLSSQAAIPPDICFSVLLNLCHGLEEAHAIRLVHRDIKPANIIFTRNGGVKLADFGLAKTTGNPASVTRYGKVLGTPAYMSPEQTRGEDVGTQSDIFSLGVVAYELVSGRRPFNGSGYAEVVDQIQHRDPEPVENLNPVVDGRFASIIGRMLARDPNTRYAKVSEVAMDLEEALDKAGWRRDRRAMGVYIRDPESYLERFNAALPETMRSGAAETATESGTKDGTRNGTGDAKAPHNPDSDYRVYLDSIDLSRETPPSFALKLSMRLRSPLPRVMGIVKNMPAVVAGRMPADRAKALAEIIRDLGGVARIEAHPVNAPTGDHAAPDDKKQEPRPTNPEPEVIQTTEYEPFDTPTRGIDAGRRGSAGFDKQTCPNCGWEESPDARFCSVCDHKFVKTEVLDFNQVPNVGEQENPLSEPVQSKSRLSHLADHLITLARMGMKELSYHVKTLPAVVRYGILTVILLGLLAYFINR